VVVVSRQPAGKHKTFRPSGYTPPGFVGKASRAVQAKLLMKPVKKLKSEDESKKN